MLVHKVRLYFSKFSHRASDLFTQFARDHYAPRFSELEQLVVSSPVDYCRAVMKIGNPEDLAGLQDRLKGSLPQATLMVVAVTASTNTGRQLTPPEWKAVQEACDLCYSLETSRRQVSSDMPSFKMPLIEDFALLTDPRLC